MRLSTLLLAAALGASGCSLFDDCGNPFDAPRFFPGVEVVVDSAPAPDTLTVAFVGPASGAPDVLVRPTHDLPFEAVGSRLRLRFDARTTGVGPAAPRFETVARGDTVFVRLADDVYGFDPDALVRRVCSPPLTSVELTVTSLRVPAGVRAVRVIQLNPYDPTVPPLPVARPLPLARVALLTA